MKICVITDDNSGFTTKEANELGVRLIRMPIIIDGEVFFENQNINSQEFFKYMEEDKDIITSQPSPGEIISLWEEILKTYDAIIHIPMSSGLSMSCATATSLAEDFKDKVFVVDNHRISVTLKESVRDALKLIKKGVEPKEIKNILEKTGHDSSIYIMVDTLKYLKKGGRITPAAALIGGTLHVKPVLGIFGGKLDAYKKCLGIKNAQRTLIDAIKNDVNQKFKDIPLSDLLFQAAYTGNDTNIKELVKVLQDELKIEGDIEINPLSLSVATHIGPGAIALTVTKKITDKSNK